MKALSQISGLIFLFSCFFSFGQTGPYFIDAGPDQNLGCAGTCTNLSASYNNSYVSYTVQSIPHNPPIAYDEPGGNTMPPPFDEKWSPIITLPFSFCFYGQTYSTLRVSSNGSIQLGSQSGFGYLPFLIFHSCPNPFLVLGGNIFGVYHKLFPPLGASVKWYIMGTAPNRFFAVSFNQVPHYDCDGYFFWSAPLQISTFMMVLHETTNEIEVFIKEKGVCNVWNNGAAIVGVQDNTGLNGIAAPGRNAYSTWSVDSTTSEGWRFTPSGVPNSSVMSWTTISGSFVSNDPNTTVCPVASTGYVASVSYNYCDGSSIEFKDTVFVNYSIPNPLLVTDSITHVSCFGSADGSIFLTVSGGTPPYNFLWNNNWASNPAPGLGSGNYTVTVTDANGCSFSGTYIVTEPTQLTVSVTRTNTSAPGAMDGSASAVVSGGTPPYVYFWSTGHNTQSMTNLPAGTYSVMVTDSNGCTVTASRTVNDPNCQSPTNLWTSRVAPTSARLNWDPVTGVDGYGIRGRAVGTTNWTSLTVAGATTSFVNVSGLPNNLTFEWQIRGICPGGTTFGPWSNLTQITTGCYPPDSLWNATVTQNAASFDWLRGWGTYGYEIRGRVFGFTGGTNILVGGGTTTNKNIFGLNPGTTYEWRIRSLCNPTGTLASAWSPWITFTTLANRGEGGIGKDIFGEESVTKVLVYPNPATDQVFVQLTEPASDERVEVRLFDLSGKEVSFSKLASSEGTLMLDLAHLPNGIYQLIIRGADLVHHEKVVIAR